LPGAARIGAPQPGPDQGAGQVRLVGRRHPGDEPARILAEPDIGKHDRATADLGAHELPGLAGQTALGIARRGQFEGVDAVEANQGRHVEAQPDARPHPHGVAIDNVDHPRRDRSRDGLAVAVGQGAAARQKDGKRQGGGVHPCPALSCMPSSVPRHRAVLGTSGCTLDVRTAPILSNVTGTTSHHTAI
jgi:hypothetical protein